MRFNEAIPVETVEVPKKKLSRHHVSGVMGPEIQFGKLLHSFRGCPHCQKTLENPPREPWQTETTRQNPHADPYALLPVLARMPPSKKNKRKDSTHWVSEHDFTPSSPSCALSNIPAWLPSIHMGSQAPTPQYLSAGSFLSFKKEPPTPRSGTGTTPRNQPQPPLRGFRQFRHSSMERAPSARAQDSKVSSAAMGSLAWRRT